MRKAQSKKRRSPPPIPFLMLLMHQLLLIHQQIHAHQLAAPCALRTTPSLSFLTLMTLISPQITHPPNSNASLIAIRRNIYRKQFKAEALRLIHASNAYTPSVDELLCIIYLACTSCGVSSIVRASSTPLCTLRRSARSNKVFFHFRKLE